MCLIAEKNSAVRHRHALKHVVHVNGTRGKSAVTRLIAAGLSEGGIRTYCKTTGTLPMTIDPEGNEELIRRRGAANISEQMGILKKAADCNAEVLVIECMAVDPELQYTAQHKILNADIGVITNVRIDHVAEMGAQLSQVCDALSNTVPVCGKLFTAEEVCFEQLRTNAEKLGTQAVQTVPLDQVTREQPFPENIALALAVCRELGVDEETARRGFARVKADPYTSSVHRLKNGAYFIDGMSANDPVSTGTVFDRLSGELEIEKKVFVLNCRADRGYRTKLMIDYILQARPDQVWLMGKGIEAAEKRLKKADISVKCFDKADMLPLNEQKEKTVIYAIGNIANDGIKLIEKVREEGEYVR